MKKNLQNINKYGKIAFSFFLAFQVVFLNSFTFNNTCHCCTNKQIIKTAGCCAKKTENKTMCSCCNKEKCAPLENACCQNNHSPFQAGGISSHCDCHKAEQTHESYIVQGQYKITPPAIDICLFPSFSPLNEYTSSYEKLKDQIKTNSPPVYITTSSLII